MALSPKSIFSLLLLLLLFYLPILFSSTTPVLSISISIGEEEEEEEFSEELLLKPLPDRKLLTHFHFQSQAPIDITLHDASFASHHHLFPKSISQLVRKFHIKAMELSFTQGRWNYERWGGFDPISSSNAKPPGVELWAIFDVPPLQVDAYWKNLTHALSGLFCASINFLESSTSYSAPKWAFQSALGSLRYGTLPREAVCTENLTPWLKLLPCRDKAGLSALMDRPSIYRSFYHSQRLHLTLSSTGGDVLNSRIILEQTLTVVLQPNNIQRAGMNYVSETNMQPSWSLSSIFGRKLNGRCVLAKSTSVYLQLERGLVTQLENLLKDAAVFSANDAGSEDFRRNIGFELSVNPEKVHKEMEKGSSILLEYPIREYKDSEKFDLGLTWKHPLVWSSPHAPLYASRFLTGSGNERGAIAISLKSTESTQGFVATNNEERCKLQVDILQIVPWYIKVYYHTLQIFVDEKPQAVKDFVERMRVSPSEDKVSPGLMELVLKFPCETKSAVLNIEFDKGFLHIDEYPPDANQGFDIPSAIISFPEFHAGLQFSDNATSESPLLSKLQEKSPVLSYSEVLLVPLTTPDFSMPYNVITITCTVFALYFGSLLNVLQRRVGEEERLLKNKDANKGPLLYQVLTKLSAKLRGRSSKSAQPLSPSSSSSSSLINPKLVLKVLLVAGIAVAWQYYSQ